MKPSSRSFAACVRLVVGLLAAAAIGSLFSLADLSAQAPAQVPVPIPGRNINMVSGTTLPGGDPFLQRQNEPSLAVSTRNPLHIFGAANDYRTVDIPGLGEEVIGDAWIGIFKSFDGGQTWKSSLLPGFRQDVSLAGRNSPLFGLEAGADPVVRAGTHGMFFMAGMAFNRDQDAGKVFVARYIDNNNLEAGDSIAYLGTSVVDIGSADRFLDKPWIAVDIPRAMQGRGRDDRDDKNDRAKYKDKKDPDWKRQDNNRNSGVPRKPNSGPLCSVPGQAQPIPAGTIYVVYSAFLAPPVQAQATDPNKPKTPREKELEREERMFGKKKREEWEEKRPGEPVEGRTKIMLVRSTDCGATFSRPQQISERSQINQGAQMAIDPNTGDLYVAWREFMSSRQPDGILLTKSTDGGRTFSSPVTVARIDPFDQGTTATSFRTNAYPAIAVDGTGRVYVAWAQRGIGPGGDARLVMSSSPNGKSWSDPVPVDNHAGRGHQIMPVLNFAGGKLHLVFWDQRDDKSRMWGQFIDDFPIVNWTGDPQLRPTRHTLDLRAISGWPGRPPVWGPSVKVSNYLEGSLPGSTQPIQLQYHVPNLPLFSLGTKPFVGDYLDVTMAPSFIANGDGTWRFNTQLSDPANFFAAWGDNRDVRPPQDGNWVHYTPPTFAGYTGTSFYDPTQPVEQCSAGQAGMRDQNVYSAKVSSGLVVATPGNNKTLGFVTGPDGVRRLIQRSFVITVSNPHETEVRSIVLHITAQPVGGVASFMQFEPLFDLPVDIAPRSSISREVFVTSSDPRATVPITVTEGAGTTATARLFLNPDPTNPDIDNPDIDNPDIDNPDIDNAEAHNITVSNPTVTNPDIDNIARANPDIDNPDIDNPDIDNSLLANLAILNPDIDNPDIDNPDIDNVDIVNPDIDNPDIDNPDIDNAALTDVTWNVSNVGNTATAYQVKLLLKQAQQQRLLNAGVRFQLVITKTTAAPTISRCAVVEPNRNLTVVTLNRPSFVDPSNAQQVSSVINPDIDNPDIDNATMALAPGDTARVTLRVYSPIGDTTTGDGGGPEPDPLDDLSGALADLQNLGVATTAHSVDTLDVIAGDTTPRISASIPLIITERLDDATRGFGYVEQIEQTGSEAPFSFAVVTGALPPGLTLNADGSIAGTPQVSGSFTFTVRLTDANEAVASATLTIRVFEPVQVVPGTLPGANINQPYSTSLAAVGGFSPFGWALASGALPAGVTLTPSGVLTGTPTQSGSFNFVAMATDIADPARAGTGAFSLSVTAAPNSQNVNVVEDTATPITVSAAGSGPFTFAIGNQPAHGTVTGAGPTFTYTPDLNYTGPDSFTFNATQGGVTSGFATVSITVTPANDAPVATPTTVNTPQGVAIPIALTGTDAEGSALSFSILSGPTTGTLSGTAPNVTYTPPGGFTGTATFTFRANDGAVFSAPATVSVIVGPPPANSADVTLSLADAPDPVALGGIVTYTATIHNNGPAVATGVALTLNYARSDLVVQSVTPSQGTCTSGNSIACAVGSIANGGNVTVVVAMRAFTRGGTFNVTSTVSGTLLDYNTANNAAAQSTVVTGPATATSDLQVSQSRAPQPVDFGSNVVYTVVVTNSGPSDASGVTLINTFTANAQYVSSTASQGACSATPNRLTCNVDDLVGGASATYTITLRANGGGSLSNTAVVSGSQADPSAANNTNTLATTIANRTPIATNDSATTNEDSVATFMLVSNDSDPDNDPLTVSSVSAALHGTTQVTGANGIVYEPAPNYNGPDSFTYQISDGRGGTATATVTVNVLSVNDAPVFARGGDQIAGQNTGAHTVEGWASAISTGPANESAQTVRFVVSNDQRALFTVQPDVSPSGTLTYTPAAGAGGVANVTVTAIDNGGTDNGGFDSSASQTFTITIDDSGPTDFTVSSTSDEGPGSLRAAIENANATPGTDTITFNLSAGFISIQPQTPLPAITDALIIDATTQPGYGGTPIVEIDGSDAGEADGLTIAANDTTIRGLVINGFSGNGIVVRGLNNVIAGNYIGTDASGLSANGNSGSGVFVDQSASATIGGDVVGDRNVISGNVGHGVHLSFCSTANVCNGSVVAGNYIGTNATGTAAIPNHLNGVHVSLVPNNVIRDNVISGNGDPDQLAYGNGIAILGPTIAEDPDAELHYGNQTIIRNRIGTDAGGAIAMPNRGNGILLTGAVTTRIGVLPSDGNTISYNLQGGVVIGVGGETPNSAVQYNTITFNNTFGIQVAQGSANWLSRNTIHSNGGLGIDLLPGANNNQAFPVLTSAVSSAGSTLINGTLTSTPDTIFTIDLFANTVADPSGNGEGQQFLGSFQTTSNASGIAGFGLSTGLLAPGTFISATAADADGNTSEFALNIVVTVPTDTNDAPSFNAGPDQSVLEDSGLQTVPSWAMSISAGPPSESGQTLNFIVSNGNNALFSGQPAIAANGTLTFTPAANANGSAIVTVQLHDNGGTANGGVDTSAPQTLTIIVSAVNDAPGFTPGGDQTVVNNSGARSVEGWATGISAGPADESAQVVSFTVSTDRTDLFSVQPAVSSTGTLTFTPAVVGAGLATVTVTAVDNGGTANGGINSSAPQTFAITVTPNASSTVVANTNDSGAGSLRAAIAFANLNPGADTITFNIAGTPPFTIQPLSQLPLITDAVTIDATTQPGPSGAPRIDLDGINAGPSHGLAINANNVTIRGFVIRRFAGSGISVNGQFHVIAGNFIGTDVTGSVANGNGGHGIDVIAGPNRIGGALPGDRNILSGNTLDGVRISSQGDTVTVQGNRIGTDVNGGFAVPNQRYGVRLDQTASALIGGDLPGEGNVVSGNELGIYISGCGQDNTCNGIVIAGNYIGTNAAGNAAIANRNDGVSISFAPNNVIRNNVISGNGAPPSGRGIGIVIQGSSLNSDPNAELHNGNQTVIGNRIGTDATGVFPVPNRHFGIVLSGAVSTRIGDLPSQGNTIAHNLQGGIGYGLDGRDTPHNVAQNNTITSNGGPGVQVANGNRNLISRNTIAGNGALGIDLGPQGVTPNDAGDADAGANTLQNFPVLTSAISSASSTLIVGTLTSTPNSTFLIELFSSTAADASGHGEGQQFLTSFQVAIGAGSSSFSAPVPLLPAGTIVTATATDSVGNTSEFSAAIAVTVETTNVAPSFTAGPSQTIAEDAALQTVPNWATAISAGPPSESGQSLNFIVSNDNNGLFAGQPSIGPGGALFILPAANANGSATVTVQLHDNGGTANGGVDTSAPQTFTITVTPVNDPPTFNPVSGLHTAPFNGGPQSVPGWVTGISAGPANEASQQVSFLVTNDNATAFAVQPAISPTGTLTYTLATGETSPTTVTVRAQDNGGILNGGIDTSAPQNFIIAVATPASADLQVSVTEAQDPILPALQFGYVAIINNQGPATATSVVFTFDLSPNGTLHSVPAGCVQSGARQLTCTTASMASGGFVAYSITASGSFGPLTATGTVTSAVTDPNLANNSATETTTINTPPTGVADDETTASGVAVYVDVLANDTDPDTTSGQEIFQISAIGGATNGIVSVTAPFVRYKPNPGFTGIDSFTYRLADAAGAESALTTVTVIVTEAICTAEPSGLISWWPGELDVNARDLRGGNAGTPQGNVQTANGFVGTAFSFDRSSGSGIRVPHAANLNPTANQVTMAAWVKPAATVIDYQAIVGKSGSYALSLNNNALAMCEIGNAPPVIGGSVQVGEWSHVACTYDGATTTLYVDGLPVAIANNELGIPLNTNALMIGGVSTAPNNEFNGLIDEVQIFNRALPIEDIFTIIAAGDAGLCEEQPVVVTDDSFIVTSDTSTTINPSSNDRDTSAAFPSVLATVRGLPVGTPQLWAPGDIGLVNSTGLAYFSGGVVNPVASGAIGILDTNTNTIVGTMAMPVPSAQTLARVNQTTNIVYLRGTTLNAVDGRPGSPTFNQVIMSQALGGIQSMALDEVRGRLYLTSSTSATSGSLFNSRFVVVDVNPASATFHQVVDQLAAPGGGVGLSVVVNSVTNKVYVAVSGGTASGVYALDVATNTWTLIPTTTNPSTLIVNDSNDLVYAVTGTSLYAIDGATNTRLALITLPSSGSTGTLDTRLAVHRPSGHVYVRLSEFPGSSRLAVIDGNRASATFNTILTTLPIGREDGQTMVVVDELNNRVIATSRTDLRTTIINATTNAIVGNTQSTQPDQRVIVDAAHHRAYIIGGITTIRSIDVTTGTLQAVLQVASEISAHAVNTQNHTAYVPQTTTGAGVSLINQTGLAGSVTLPHVDGRETFAVRNRVTNRIYALNTNATAVGGSDGVPGFVHVIDGASNAVLASVPVGPFPFGIGINEATNKIYVGNSFAGSILAGGITVIDGATNATVQADMSQIPTTSATPGQISVGRDMVANTATGKLYFRVIGGSNVTLGILDGTTNVATPLADDGEVIGIVRVNPSLNKVYVGAQETAADPTFVYILDGTTHDMLAALQVGSPTPFIGTQSYLAVNVTTGRVFVADYEHDRVDVIDGTTNEIVASIAVGDGPSTVAVNEALNRIYVGNALDQTLTIIDGNTMRVAATLSLPLTPVRLEVDESVSQIFALSALIEPGVMVIDDPGTIAPAISSVTNGSAGTTVLNADGSVTYTPNAGFVGNDTFTYTIPDGLGGFRTGTVHVTVASPLSIPTAASLPTTSVGLAYPGAVLTVIGGTTPYYWSITSGQLPPGLALNSTLGTIAGAAVQAGTYIFTAQARDSSNPRRVATKVFTINVGPPIIVTTTLPGAFIGEMYDASVVVAGATGAVTWSINTNNNPLLNWLSITNGGLLVGTPPAVGSMPSFTVTATDSLNQVASRSLSLFVSGPLDVEPLREGVVLESQPAMSIIGGNGTRAVTVTSGALPPGLTLNSSGSFTGTPTRHGTFNFTLEVRDCSPLNTCSAGASQQVVSKNLTLRVSAKDQQGNSQTQPAISFGGSGGRRMAQVVTVGAAGTLTGVGLQNISCPAITPLSILIQRLTVAGFPDGTSIATGTATTNYNAISVTPTVNMSIGEKFAFIVSSPVACTFTNAATIDQYNAGDAYVDAGSGWVSLFGTDGRYDLPSFRTLLQPAMDVGYLTNSRVAGTTSTLLSNGTVLLTGTGVAAEIYNPATNSTSLTGSMSTQRNQHTATLLQDGTVLIVGGQSGGVRHATAETYDPATGTFSLAAGPMSVGRDVHAATRMNDGRVLITGGNINITPTSSQQVATAEIYDPVSRTFTPAPNMGSTRQVHNSILLPSGRVLVASGYIGGSRTAEIYDPVANTFTATAGNMSVPRGWSAAEMLSDGRVLITGGQNGPLRNTAEIYDPVTDSFTSVGSMASLRYQHSMTRLADGTVLVAGGYDEPTSASYVLPLASMERFNPATNSFTPAGGLEARRARHNAIRLPNNTIFLAGGGGQSWMTANTGEIYSPSSAPALTTTTVPVGQVGVAYPATTLQATGGSGAPYQMAIVSGVLPPGLTLGATFTLSGTPTVNGTFPVGIRVTDSLSQSTVEALTIQIGAPLVITTPYQLVSGALNHPYDVQLTASAPAVFSLAPASALLPAGMVLGADGRLTGTPTEAIGRTFSVRAVDALGRSAVKTFNVTISSPLAITTTILPEAAVKESYTFCLSSANGVTSNSWSVIGGTMPPGVTLLSNGCFSSAPTSLGTFNPLVQVTDLASPPQVATRTFGIRVSAKDQEGGSQTQPVISFGGAGGRRLAQTVTVGANGTLTAYGFNSTTTCTSPNVLTVDVQRLNGVGLPDGTTIASGSTSGSLSGIALSPLAVSIGDRLAFVLSSTNTCTVANVPATSDSYQAGDGLVDAGSGWASLFATDGRYDIPFRTMITPATEVAFMNRSRNSFGATVLNDGRVLLTSNGNPADLYDPVTRTITPTGNMITPRSNHTATLLADGTVLLAGGRDVNSVQLTTAEIYDPVTGTFTPTDGLLTVPHEDATAARLNDGRVFIAGGRTLVGSQILSIPTTEIYDPVSRTFTFAGNMLTDRHRHTAALLNDGRVLLIAGFTGGISGSVTRSAEIFDPITGSFTATAGSMATVRGSAAAARLADGRILVTGGQSGDLVNTAEIYNPATDSFTSTGNMISRRFIHTATTLADGSVLIAGGFDEVNSGSYILPLGSMERFLPASGTFVPAGGMETRRAFHAAALLQDGRVLLAGGSSQSWMSGNTVELYDPLLALALSPGALPDAQPGVAYTPVTLIASGGTGPYQISMLSGALPPGMTYNPATFVLAGTPAANVIGTFALGFQVTDSASHRNLQTLLLHVGAINTITDPYRLPDARVGVPYSLQLSATGPGPITWLNGPPSSLPPGLALSAAGVISGTPTTQAFNNFAVRAVDAQGRVAIKTLSISVTQPMTITTTSLGDGYAGQSYFACFGNTNGTAPFTWSITGLPGASFQTFSNCLNSAYPNGTIRQAGAYTATVSVTDSSSTPQMVSRDFTITFHAQDQYLSTETQPNISLPATRRVAQVIRAASPYPMTGVQLWSLQSCTANTQITAAIRPITAARIPDETGLPLATATTTVSSSGGFNNFFVFGSPLAMPQGAYFAVVLSFANGSCLGTNWPTDDYYQFGEGWVDDGGGWQRTSTALGRPDVAGITTFVMPDATPRFLQTWRDSDLAVSLGDSRILYTGGSDTTAEIYAPATNTVTPTLTSTASFHSGGTATLLTNGRVLIVGGSFWNGTQSVAVAGSEIFDPATGTFTAGASMPEGRYGHKATVLADGRVLISGGWTISGGTSPTLATAVVYAANGLSAATVSMTGARVRHSATRLADGRVLIAGGWTGAPFPPTSAEIYDPSAGANGTFTSIGNAMIGWPAQHTGTLITTGSHTNHVLIAGGTYSWPDMSTATQFFDPATSSFSAGPPMVTARYDLTALRLADGRVMFAGGSTSQITWQPTADVEFFNPSFNGFVTGRPMAVDQTKPSLSPLATGPNNGKIAIVAGGGNSVMAGRMLDFYDPSISAIRIATVSLPNVALNGSYSATLSSNAGSGGYQYAVVWGHLPAGLILSGNTISGNVSNTADYQEFVIRVTDSAANTAYRAFSIAADPLTITSPTELPPGFTNTNYSYQLTSTGGIGSATWALVGSLPPGFSVTSGGLITGVTSTPQNWNAVIKVTDAAGVVQYRNFFLLITNPIELVNGQ